MDMILRNFLFKVLDHYRSGGKDTFIKVDGVKTSDERNAIAEELVQLGCLDSNWKATGRYYIGGEFDQEKILKLIQSGKIG